MSDLSESIKSHLQDNGYTIMFNNLYTCEGYKVRHSTPDIYAVYKTPDDLVFKGRIGSVEEINLILKSVGARYDKSILTTSLAAAKEKLYSERESGTHCLCCGQHVKMYKRKLNAGMAHALMNIYNLDKQKGRKQPGRYLRIVDDFVKRRISVPNSEYQKLAYWGLIESKPHNEDKKKRDSGLWRITDLGRRFVLKDTTVPKYVFVYNGGVEGYSDEKITISQALGEKFDYTELMDSFNINEVSSSDNEQQTIF